MHAEQARLARELHDSTAQVLAAAQLRLLALTAHPDLASDALRAELTDLASTCRDALAETRDAIDTLRVPDASGSLVERLTRAVERLGRRGGVRPELRADADADLAPDVATHVTRIVSEALTNARKHAAAASVIVTVEGRGEALRIAISDDGVGFAPAGIPADAPGFGLAAMRERAWLVGGRLRVDSAPGRGTTVILTIPHAHQAAPS